MSRRVRLMLLALGALAVCSMVIAPAAMAQPEDEVKILAGEDEKPVTNAEAHPSYFDIGIDGETFFEIRASAAGFSAAERARIVYARIIHIISYGRVDPASVHIDYIRGKPTIYVGNVRLITVYPNDVAAAGAASMEELAQKWAAGVACCLERVAPWPKVADAE